MQTDILSTELGGIANLALLAPIKPGFVDRYETITYARRLELLLKTVNAIRLASRESALIKSPFPDAVGRTGILHSFRYAIVPPELGSKGEPAPIEAEPRPGVYRLSLNVTFDGGWEPYIRVIHRDLGPLLDAIFCNCTGYPEARLHSFYAYTRWVRDHEIPGGLFYTESPMTVEDQRYLAAVERTVREQRKGVAAADLARARFALREPPDLRAVLAAFEAAPAAVRQETMRLHLKALKGLYDLTTFYPKNDEGDDLTLLSFAQSALPEFRAVLPSPVPGPLPAELLPYAAPIGWLKTEIPVATPIERAAVLAPDPRRIQGGIVTRYDGITHGCLVLLRVTDAEQARRSLAGLELSIEGGAPRLVQCNVALTLQGLKALGVPKWRIDMFPHEFLEGMEARAGALGDVRGNHPDFWRRPRFGNDPSKPEIDLGAVHVVVQYRFAGSVDQARRPQELQAKLDELGRTQGLRILAVESMRSYPDKAGFNREHFGFRDGFSQPVISDAIRPEKPAFEWNDGVRRGEIFLGYANDRGDGPYPPREDPLLDDGTFLAIRKMRQHVGRLEHVLRTAAEARTPRAENDTAEAWRARVEQAMHGLKARLMGRDTEGATPVAPDLGAPARTNVFDYSKDPAGQKCPFQSHARRTNPRTHLPMPRIIRRGMSYGPLFSEEADAERGIYFMAYCASLAEQFEVIQRWVAGGNSSGGLSAHSDPFLGVPQKGEARVYEYFDAAGALQRIDLGSEPFTELQWGVYLFVPSVTALANLESIVSEGQASARDDQGEADAREQGGARCPAFTAWQQSIEDPNERKKAWQRVIDAPDGEGKLETPYGLLIAKQEPVLEALKDDGKTMSVCGYGRRFAQTIGPGYLGLDAQAHTAQAETPSGAGVNQAIADISVEEAFEKAFGVTSAMLEHAFPSTPHPTRRGGFEKNVDIVILSEMVLASLCTAWFGLPDARQEFMGDRRGMGSAKARCPGHFVSVSRYVFWPYPSDAETEEAKAHGAEILEAVTAFLQAAEGGAAVLGPLSGKIKDVLAPQSKSDPGLLARTLAGVMLGFPPTVHLNFLRVMTAWVGNNATTPSSTPKVSLWDLQADLIAEGATGRAPSPMLQDALFAQMREYPGPELVWRESPGSTPGPGGAEPHKTVLGLAAVMQDPQAHPLVMFGGAHASNKSAPPALHTVHGCPGYSMAVGVLLGMITAILLTKGTLRPTASPAILNVLS